MINEEMSPGDYVKFLMDKFYEYRMLAADPTLTTQASKLYLDKASEYYARAQEEIDKTAPDMTDHLSDEDKALPNVPMNENNENNKNMNTEDIIQKLIDMASKGEFNNDQIRDLGQQLISARKRYFTSQRSPESYKAAVEKGKATKVQNAKDSEEFQIKSKAYHDKLDAEFKARQDGGMLPIYLDDYGKKPNPKYYTYTGADPKSGIGMYKLRDKYKNTVIGTKNEDGTVNPVTDTDVYAPQGATPSRKSYMEEIDTNRWAELSGLNK